jgi:hypothetical protein
MNTTVVFVLRLLVYFTLISVLELAVLKAIKHNQTNTRTKYFQHRQLREKYEKMCILNNCVSLSTPLFKL